MESKEKCEQIIQIFNGKALSGAKDPLLVKFADGGNKKKSLFKGTIWRETGEVYIFSNLYNIIHFHIKYIRIVTLHNTLRDSYHFSFFLSEYDSKL